jgi:hypothetical protein
MTHDPIPPITKRSNPANDTVQVVQISVGTDESTRGDCCPLKHFDASSCIFVLKVDRSGPVWSTVFVTAIQSEVICATATTQQKQGFFFSKVWSDPVGGCHQLESLGFLLLN